MLKNHTSTEALLTEATAENLYVKLVAQLNKDFQLANIDESFPAEITPNELKKSLHEILYLLIQNDFTDYLNLLYIVDVSENKIKSLETVDLLKLSEQVMLLVLKREWQKVWFKNKLSQKE